ncbi:alkanesulfonate monooxygenase SsuD/methylene tetrahydromethanopterin reductase-like flavin-dependent oxidoreductase (luciferase family) [Nonomuraea thailandensis]|uniref:Alkanesulfonate monooxygenase SsuD/methylene tetrahydromethanopterin reductase-like flavin-dependent oxidoreductase (Luciferase family) n=1 Tax=Nonomuraea thailandensis TaxID=1188745 RepID=A0A9X2GHF7_9ACTN|nr:LLM class flavin-dependent oxidoreductase [Nonomuraea thailandensis]MCP2357574.1 alkanesulfonate monooxygenase SsuD/methylene tetrahydromethanopterin reductase-like flavin-dependent oxidoreductase (luciferase family) [Nonomuraea thailandensis]
MRAGVVVTAHPGVEDLAVQAEELGLDSFWVYDTPMVHGDPFITLGLCAKATSRIRLGIGVTSPALRSAPAAASAFASLNALAPGRIICGIGTGNTARRTLGMRPTTAATLESFTAALQDLCAGRTIEYREGDRARDVRFLHVGARVNTADPIEFVVAALGPKAAAVAGRLGAGLISFGLLDPTAWRALHDARRRAAHDASRAPGSRTSSYVVTALHVLGEDEDPRGDAARDATGHIVLPLLAFAADTAADTAADARPFAEQLGPEEREVVRRLLDRRGTTATAPDRHTKLYLNYLERIAPEDRDLILPSLMSTLALVGTRDDLRARITTLEQAGIDELLIQPVIDPPTEMARFAKLLT